MRVYGVILVLAVAIAQTHCLVRTTAMANMVGMWNYTNLQGTVYFEQIGNNMRISGLISGLQSGLHGFHIHETGNITNNCASAGAHYNPFNQTHGGLDTAVRHYGDIGNVMADASGRVTLDITMRNTSLIDQYGVINRTITIHEDIDDLGTGSFPDSQTTGHSGRRVGCGIIKQSAASSISMWCSTATLCAISMLLAIYNRGSFANGA